MSVFQKATRSQQKLRVAIDGPSGAGKTYSALRLAFSLVDAGLATKVAVIDSENGSASMYAGEQPDGRTWDFDTLALKSFSPDQYTFAINEAFKAGYDCLVIDSLSHAWSGEGGALDIVDNKGGNKFTAWKDVTPIHRRMVDAIIRAKGHVICTMRSKTEYIIEEDDKGKKVPRKIGVAPVQRDGMEYEFDVYGSVDWSNMLKISKSRCPALQGMSTVKPGPAFWSPLFDWLKTAKPVERSDVPDLPPEPYKAPESSADIFDRMIPKLDTVTSEESLKAVATELKDVTPKLDKKHLDDLTRKFLAVKAKVKAGPASDSKSVA